MKTKILLAAAGLLCVAGAALAQPSMYYLWKNTSTGETRCEAESPRGPGWVKVSETAYEDLQCTKPL